MSPSPSSDSLLYLVEFSKGPSSQRDRMDFAIVGIYYASPETPLPSDMLPSFRHDNWFVWVSIHPEHHLLAVAWSDMAMNEFAPITAALAEHEDRIILAAKSVRANILSMIKSENERISDE